jgi:hypothetical protein
LKIIPFDELNHLPQLIRLGLTAYILQIQWLRNSAMSQNMMTAFDPGNPKPQSPGKR